MLPRRWHTLQPLFDQALALNSQERVRHIDQVRQSDPALALELEQLLESHRDVEQSDFLQQSLASTLFTGVKPGHRFGPYELTQPLGEGGMGSVWLARRGDGRYEGQVAIKLLSRNLSSQAAAARFQREGQILAKLTHPHIARLLDAGLTPQGQPFLVLEYVEGLPIDEFADAQALSLSARLNLFLALLAAVTHAHHWLIVHRDIKPSNVMVTRDGQVKLLDFGIAKLLADQDPHDAPLTQRAELLLSHGYAAPEQLRAETVTPAIDVFALGVLLYVLLSGEHPYLRPGEYATDAMRRTLEHDAPRLVQANLGLAGRRGLSTAALKKALAGDLDNIVAKALHRDIRQRYATVDALALDIQRHLQHLPVQARTPRLSYRVGKFIQRQRKPLIAFSVCAVALTVQGVHSLRQRQAAQVSQARAQSVDGLLQSILAGMSPDLAPNRNFQARELLDRGRDYLNQAPGFDAETRRAANLRLATLYRDLGVYPQALDMFREEAQLAESQNDLRGLAMALWHVAGVQLKLDDYEAAQVTLNHMANVLDQGPKNDADLFTRLTLLRGELQLQTHHDLQARDLFEVAAAQGVTGDLELQARLAWDRGRAEQHIGELNQARLHLMESHALLTSRGPSAQVDLLHLTLDLGTLENWTGHFDTAIQRLLPAQADLERRLGQHSFMVEKIDGQLAYANLRQGHLAQARQWAVRMREAADLQAKVRDDYPALIEALVSMHEGRLAQAEAALRSLLRAKLQTEQGVSVSTEPLRRMHAEALLRLGRVGEALIELQTAETNLIPITKPPHSGVAITRVLKACALARLGELNQARELWRESYTVLHAALGPQHPFTLAAHSYLAVASSEAEVSSAERAQLAQRLRQELGWQGEGARTLANWLSQTEGRHDWRRLPTVL